MGLDLALEAQLNGSDLTFDQSHCRFGGTVGLRIVLRCSFVDDIGPLQLEQAGRSRDELQHCRLVVTANPDFRVTQPLYVFT